jgi:hypothetical protein
MPLASSDHNNSIGIRFEGEFTTWHCLLSIVLNSFYIRRITLAMTEQISNPLRELANDAIKKVDYETANKLV